MASADVKDTQGQMLHSMASTTLDIYQQFVPSGWWKSLKLNASRECRIVLRLFLAAVV